MKVLEGKRISYQVVPYPGQMRDGEELTGLQVGGISALALLNRGFAVYLDASARECEQIYVSAGERGLDLKIGVNDLVKVTRARFADVAGYE